MSPSLVLLGNRLKDEADDALTQAREAPDPITKRDWLDVAERAMQTYQRILEMQRYPHA